MVENNISRIFGPYALYLPKREVKTSGGTRTIPDGFAIDLDSNEWFIVENEMGEHTTWNHIAPQVSKQITTFQNRESRNRIHQLAMDLLNEEDGPRRILKELDIADLHASDLIRDILDQAPGIAIPIDDIPSDLEHWAKTLKNEVFIWEIKKYKSQTTEDVIYALPDELTPTLKTDPETDTTISTYELQGRDLMLQMIKEDYVAPGDHLHMTYKPRGGQKHEFQAEVLENGNLLVDEEEFSSSSMAAVHCIQKTGSDRETENGLRKWETKEGQTLAEVRKEILTSENNNEPNA